MTLKPLLIIESCPSLFSSSLTPQKPTHKPETNASNAITRHRLHTSKKSPPPHNPNQTAYFLPSAFR